MPGQGFNNLHSFLFTRSKQICYSVNKFLVCIKAVLLVVCSNSGKVAGALSLVQIP